MVAQTSGERARKCVARTHRHHAPSTTHRPRPPNPLLTRHHVLHRCAALRDPDDRARDVLLLDPRQLPRHLHVPGLVRLPQAHQPPRLLRVLGQPGHQRRHPDLALRDRGRRQLAALPAAGLHYPDVRPSQLPACVMLIPARGSCLLIPCGPSPWPSTSISPYSTDSRPAISDSRSGNTSYSATASRSYPP